MLHLEYSIHTKKKPSPSLVKPFSMCSQIYSPFKKNKNKLFYIYNNYCCLWWQGEEQLDASETSLIFTNYRLYLTSTLQVLFFLCNCDLTAMTPQTEEQKQEEKTEVPDLYVCLVLNCTCLVHNSSECHHQLRGEVGKHSENKPRAATRFMF